MIAYNEKRQLQFSSIGHKPKQSKTKYVKLESNWMLEHSNLQAQGVFPDFSTWVMVMH